jgi:hypothetical protein
MAKRQGTPNGASRSVASRDASPYSDVIEDVLTFAANLRANANEAMRFHEAEVAARLGGNATRKAETQFTTRAGKLAAALRTRSADLALLEACCPPEVPCRRIIEDLVSGGLHDALLRLADEMEGIYERSIHPLSADSLQRLSHDRASLLQNVSRLIEIAAWIEEEARAIRGNPAPWRAATTAPPEPFATLLTSAEEGARTFLRTMAKQPISFERQAEESTLAWLGYLVQEKNRCKAETDAFAAVLGKFTDEHLEAAEQAGHERLVEFLNEREAVVNRIAARRDVSIALTQAAIEDLIRRLSLTDDGADAAANITHLLNGIDGLLLEQRQLLAAAASRATRNRQAAAVTERELPAWMELGQVNDAGHRRKVRLWMLVSAFQDPDADEQRFVAMERKDLHARLECLFGNEVGGVSEAAVYRLLKDAEKLKVVFVHDRREGTPKTVGDRFELCRAAIRKYGRHVTSINARPTVN